MSKGKVRITASGGIARIQKVKQDPKEKTQYLNRNGTFQTNRATAAKFPAGGTKSTAEIRLDAKFFAEEKGYEVEEKE